MSLVVPDVLAAGVWGPSITVSPVKCGVVYWSLSEALSSSVLVATWVPGAVHLVGYLSPQLAPLMGGGWRYPRRHSRPHTLWVQTPVAARGAVVRRPATWVHTPALPLTSCDLEPGPGLSDRPPTPRTVRAATHQVPGRLKERTGVRAPRGSWHEQSAAVSCCHCEVVGVPGPLLNAGS